MISGSASNLGNQSELSLITFDNFECLFHLWWELLFCNLTRNKSWNVKVLSRFNLPSILSLSFISTSLQHHRQTRSFDSNLIDLKSILSLRNFKNVNSNGSYLSGSDICVKIFTVWLRFTIENHFPTTIWNKNL